MYRKNVQKTIFQRFTNLEQFTRFSLEQGTITFLAKKDLYIDFFTYFFFLISLDMKFKQCESGKKVPHHREKKIA